jgi:hypothetical protein
MQGVYNLKTLFMILLRAVSRAGSIEHAAQRSNSVAESVMAAQEYVQRSEVVGADKTGFRQSKNDGNNPRRRKAMIQKEAFELLSFGDG